MSIHQFKPGDKKIFKHLGKSIPVKIIQTTKYGIECEFLASAPPVEKGEKMFCDPTLLFDEEPAVSVRSCINCPNLINGKFEAYGDIKNIVTCSRFGFWTFSGSIQDFTACDAIDRPVKKIADSTTKKRLKQHIHCGMCIHFTKIGDGRRCMGRCDLIVNFPCCSSRFNDTENHAPECREFKQRKGQQK